jgi:AAA domain
MSENNPLLAFSLAGEGGALTEKAIKQEPLLGDVCLKGESTVWYAKPNTGKTLIALALITDAVNDHRISPHDVFYINADDSQAGYAAKVKILDDFGIHTLVPGEKGFSLTALIPALTTLAERGEASGKLIVVDTIKKVADLMDKRAMRKLGLDTRPFTMGGGALLLLAHTNKARGAKGELIYAGTSDLMEDVDCAYLIDERPNIPYTARSWFVS